MKHRWIVAWGVLCAAFAQAGTIKVACIGDSITWGTGLEDRATESYPARLQALLGNAYTVRNFGAPGRGAYRDNAYSATPEHAAALAWQPDIVISNLGINDAEAYDASPRFAADYCTLLQTYAGLPSKPKLYLWTKLAPLTEKHRLYRSPAPFLMQRDLEIVADRIGAARIDMQYPFETIALQTMPDGIHPNAKGMARIAEITAKAMTPPAALTLPYYFGHAMVLPAETAFTIRGTAKPGVAVTCGALSAVADRRGEWSMIHPATPPSAEGITLAFKAGDETREFFNVLFGDLWVCAGQSNMDFAVTSSANAREIRAAATNANLRVLRWGSLLPVWGEGWNETQLERSKTPGLFGGAWRAVDSPGAASDLSAIGVMFGQGLLAARPGIPVGIIQIAVGGAPVEAFLPKWRMAAHAPLVPLVTARGPWYHTVGFVLEAHAAQARKAFKYALPRYDLSEMMHPLGPETIWRCAFEPLFFARGSGEAFPVKGVVWYQGESNAVAPKNTRYPADPAYMRAGIDSLIEALRSESRNADLPVIMVQLPKFNQPWMLFREAQSQAAKAFPRTGLVVSTDTGDMKDIHPRDKKPIADRCLAEALRLAYGNAGAPAFTFAESAAREGDSVIVTFSGPALAQTVSPAGVELSADGETFLPAMSVTRLDDSRMRAQGISEPAAIRYNWAPDPPGRLLNAAGLPIAPFRWNQDQNREGGH